VLRRCSADFGKRALEREIACEGQSGGRRRSNHVLEMGRRKLPSPAGERGRRRTRQDQISRRPRKPEVKLRTWIDPHRAKKNRFFCRILFREARAFPKKPIRPLTWCLADTLFVDQTIGPVPLLKANRPPSNDAPAKRPPAILVKARSHIHVLLLPRSLASLLRRLLHGALRLLGLLRFLSHGALLM